MVLMHLLLYKRYPSIRAGTEFINENRLYLLSISKFYKNDERRNVNSSMVYNKNLFIPDKTE